MEPFDVVLIGVPILIFILLLIRQKRINKEILKKLEEEED